NCKVSFPPLYDIDWWEGSKPAAVSAGQKLRAADGDCAVSLAHAAGFRNYHDVWDRAENAVLKQNRPNPNILATNDEVSAPDEKSKEITKGVDTEWPLVVEALKKPKLRVVLVDKDLKPHTGWKWDLSSPKVQSGATDANGLIEVPDLDPSAKTGQLKVM